MKREACVCDHGLERSDLCAEIIIIIIITTSQIFSFSKITIQYTTWKHLLKNNRDPNRDKSIGRLHR